jgi:hypothetical protein
VWSIIRSRGQPDWIGAKVRAAWIFAAIHRAPVGKA